MDDHPTDVAPITNKAQMECPHGHSLTAFGVRPPDYRKFDGAGVAGSDGGWWHSINIYATIQQHLASM